MKRPETMSPVALFTYARPMHTRETIKALRENEYAENTELIVFSDAPKDDASELLVKEVRKVISEEARGFKSVQVIERNRNLGLAASIIDGVGMITESEGSVIVLEDDLITSKYFLRFMNDGLNIYSDEPKVWHISGYRYPIELDLRESTFFFRVPLCWGWATWKRSWVKYKKSNDYDKLANPVLIKDINISGSFDYWSQYELNKSGAIDTWFIFWYLSSYFGGGVTLYPSESLVRNIGHDGSGVHGDKTRNFSVELSKRRLELVFRRPLEEKEVLKAHVEYFESIKPSFIRRLVSKARKGWL